ncbi:uncharacterized protein LOC119093410 [Pollicipes pollicipes]|uniref:uncharacterized protein LOC119093410 n=1 Tax=Pollicipes pollicipes TaxID=41117 RepID=UPI001884C01D|nr:uncharacterized protein LOC119093410 [Pollicipes pollicipes]
MFSDSQFDESECTELESDEEIESEPEEDVEEWVESVGYIRRCALLCGLPADLWDASHDEKIATFLKDETRPMITFFVETDQEHHKILTALFGAPIQQVDEVIYFLKRPSAPPVLSDLNYRGKVAWGNMKAPFLESLLIPDVLPVHAVLLG